MVVFGEMPEKQFEIPLSREVFILVSWVREGGRVLTFRILLLMEHEGECRCVARYDTAHGFAHLDILGMRKGLLAKRPLLGQSYSEAIEYAIRDFKENWKDYVRSYLAN